jgi:hypothetical protein
MSIDYANLCAKKREAKDSTMDCDGDGLKANIDAFHD